MREGNMLLIDICDSDVSVTYIFLINLLSTYIFYHVYMT